MADTNIYLGITCKITECISCGIPIAVPLSVYEQHRKTGGFYHCANGHSQGWEKDRSTDGDIRRERDRLKQQLAQKDDEIERQRVNRVAAERSAAAHKGQVTRLKNRSKAGVCPCCNRTFKQLAAHMKNKHPNFDPAEPIKLVATS